MNVLQKYFNFFILCLVTYLVIDKIFYVEKMSNTDIKKIIKDEYQIDVDAIRNLSKLANDLTINNKLIVPGGLEIQGPLKVTKDITTDGNGYFGPAFIGKHGKNDSRFAQFSHKNMTATSQYAFLQGADGKTFINTANKAIYFRNNNSDGFTMANNGNMDFKGNVTIDKNLNVKKQTTLHELYGGKSSINGFRAIQVNGGHIMFNVGGYGYGFHSNGYRYQRYGNSYSNNNFSGKVYVNGDLQTSKNLNASKVNISGSDVHLLTLNKTNKDQTNLIEFKYKGTRKIRLGIDGNSKPWYGSVRGWSR